MAFHRSHLLPTLIQTGYVNHVNNWENTHLHNQASFLLVAIVPYDGQNVQIRQKNQRPENKYPSSPPNQKDPEQPEDSPRCQRSPSYDEVPHIPPPRSEQNFCRPYASYLQHEIITGRQV